MKVKRTGLIISLPFAFSSSLQSLVMNTQHEMFTCIVVVTLSSTPTLVQRVIASGKKMLIIVSSMVFPKHSSWELLKRVTLSLHFKDGEVVKALQTRCES